MTREQIKDRIMIGGAAAAFIVIGLAFWKMVAAFLWICYYLGITM